MAYVLRVTVPQVRGLHFWTQRTQRDAKDAKESQGHE
jgi:hypothetical protein